MSQLLVLTMADISRTICGQQLHHRQASASSRRVAVTRASPLAMVSVRMAGLAQRALRARSAPTVLTVASLAAAILYAQRRRHYRR